MKLDEIGPWSEVKLEIIRKYATAYSVIMTKRKFRHFYIDGFCGAGMHVSRQTGEYVAGSPLNALLVDPPFREFHLIDLDAERVDFLRDLAQDRPEVKVYSGDCNDILFNRILPEVRYDQYRRALCLLDPYGLQLDWRVIELAGHLGTVDLFLNFPTMHMNRNVLRGKPDAAIESEAKRMTAFWGDESWREVAWRKQPTLFGDEDQKRSNQAVAEAFRRRLRDAAGFEYVADPLPMRNSKGATLYYVFFASPKPVAEDIIRDIFKPYR